MKTHIKYTHILLLTGCLFLVNCRSQVKEKQQEMIPVEADGGIGDGAEPIDSLLQYQTPPVISEEKRKELEAKRDSI